MSHQKTRLFTARHNILIAVAALMIALAALIPSGNDTELTLPILTFSSDRSNNATDSDTPQRQQQNSMTIFGRSSPVITSAISSNRRVFRQPNCTRLC